MTARTTWPSLFVLIVLLLSCHPAFGNCFFEPWKLTKPEKKAAIAKEFNESAAVFSGEVIALDVLAVRCRVITTWKGDAFEEFTMSTGATKIAEDNYASSSLVYDFKVGEKYLVYARLNDNYQLVARSCTRTKTLSIAQADIDELDFLNRCEPHLCARGGKSACDLVSGHWV